MVMSAKIEDLPDRVAIYRTLLDDSSDPIFAITENGTYLYINKVFGDHIKRNPDEVVGLTLWDVFPKEAADQRFAGIKAVLSSQQTNTIEVVVEEGENKHFFITTIKPMQKINGPADAVICISKNITDRKKAGDELFKLNQELEKRVEERTAELIAANERLHAEIAERKRAKKEREEIESQLRQSQKMDAVGRLAGGLAHDFNNMLSVILGNAELALIKLPQSSPLYENISEIATAGRRSADLTRQLLAFARKQVIAPKILDINGTIENMLKMLRRLIGEEIRLHWKPGTDLWTVKMDPVQIDQIMANLLVNARDAIEGAGNVTIETENSVLDSSFCDYNPGSIPGQYMQIKVSDDGCGIDGYVLVRLFEPFFTTKQLGRGTGLGLATVYGIVKQNHGFIRVDSEKGKGTDFKIYIPRHQSANAEIGETTIPSGVPGGTETVLLVEDNAMILETTSRMLKHLGYKVMDAGSGKDALRIMGISKDQVDLLLTDVVMPGMSGFELFNRVIAIKPGLKVLYMSGYSYDLIARHGVLDDGVSLIKKPLTISALAYKLREVIDRKP